MNLEESWKVWCCLKHFSQVWMSLKYLSPEESFNGSSRRVLKNQREFLKILKESKPFGANSWICGRVKHSFGGLYVSSKNTWILAFFFLSSDVKGILNFDCPLTLYQPDPGRFTHPSTHAYPPCLNIKESRKVCSSSEWVSKSSWINLKEL